MNCFTNSITVNSTLSEDWTNLLSICTQLKFYSPSVVKKMSQIFGQKWGVFVPEDKNGLPEASSKAESIKESLLSPDRRKSLGQSNLKGARLHSERSHREQGGIQKLADHNHESPFILILLQKLKETSEAVQKACQEEASKRRGRSVSPTRVAKNDMLV